jgi:hypothetical protein
MIEMLLYYNTECPVNNSTLFDAFLDAALLYSTLPSILERYSTLYYLMMLDATRRCPMLFDALLCSTLPSILERYSTLYYLMLLNAARRYLTLLDATRRCSTLPDASRRNLTLCYAALYRDTRRSIILLDATSISPKCSQFFIFLFEK